MMVPARTLGVGLCLVALPRVTMRAYLVSTRRQHKTAAATWRLICGRLLTLVLKL